MHSVPGVVHVPVAQSLASGEAWFAWSNFTDRTLVPQRTPNFHVAFGLWRGLTVAGRISAYTPDLSGSSGLSLHAHWKIPWIPRNWFDLAVGVQDFGGAISPYRGQYIVASREFGPLLVNLGWGHSDVERERGRGVLGALVWRPHPVISVGTEWDGARLNANARLQTPRAWFGGLAGLGAQAAVTGLTGDPRFFASAYIQMALASSPAIRRQAAQPLSSPRRDLRWGQHPWRRTAHIEPIPVTSSARALPAAVRSRIHRRLAALDLEDIRMASVAGGVRICVDNSVFERSAIDAMGVVLGVLATELSATQRIELTITKHAYPLMRISTRAGAFARMLEGRPPPPHLLRVQAAPANNCPRPPQRSDRPFGRPRLSLSPALRSVVASELGVLNLQLGARWGLLLPMAWGSSLSLQYQHRIWATPDFRRDHPLYELRLRRGFREAAVHQAIPLPKGMFGLFSAGLFRFNRWTTALHLRYQRGIHSIGAFGGVHTHRFDHAFPSALLDYRIEWPGGTTALRFQGGQFPDQSRGLRVALQIAWGDTLLSATYRYGQAQALGLGLAVPLTPRKNRLWRYKGVAAQLGSTASFGHAVHTRVGEQHNNLVGPGWLDPGLAFGALETIYTERGRLTESRVAHSARRMRDAYYRYAASVGPDSPPGAPLPTRNARPEPPAHPTPSQSTKGGPRPPRQARPRFPHPQRKNDAR